MSNFASRDSTRNRIQCAGRWVMDPRLILDRPSDVVRTWFSDKVRSNHCPMSSSDMPASLLVPGISSFLTRTGVIGDQVHENHGRWPCKSLPGPGQRRLPRRRHPQVSVPTSVKDAIICELAQRRHCSSQVKRNQTKVLTIMSKRE